MELTNVQQFFAIPELVEQVILELEDFPTSEDATEQELLDARIAYIKRLHALRSTNDFLKNLIDGSPKIRRRMNVDRLADDGLSFQVTATIIDQLLRQFHNSWGCELNEFNYCQVQDDDADVIVYDVEATPNTSSSKRAMQTPSCINTKLAPDHMSTIVRINVRSPTSNEVSDSTFVLAPGSTISDLFKTFDTVSAQSQPEPTSKRSREANDDEASTKPSSPRMLKRTKHRCDQHPGWESCIHLSSHTGLRNEGVIMYAA